MNPPPMLPPLKCQICGQPGAVRLHVTDARARRTHYFHLCDQHKVAGEDGSAPAMSAGEDRRIRFAAFLTETGADPKVADEVHAVFDDVERSDNSR